MILFITKISTPIIPILLPTSTTVGFFFAAPKTYFGKLCFFPNGQMRKWKYQKNNSGACVVLTNSRRGIFETIFLFVVVHKICFPWNVSPCSLLFCYALSPLPTPPKKHPPPKHPTLVNPQSLGSFFFSSISRYYYSPTHIRQRAFLTFLFASSREMFSPT